MENKIRILINEVRIEELKILIDVLKVNIYYQKFKFKLAFIVFC